MKPIHLVAVSLVCSIISLVIPVVTTYGGTPWTPHTITQIALALVGVGLLIVAFIMAFIANPK